MKRQLRGVKLNTPAGAGNDSTSFDVVKQDGRIVGVSVGEHYARTDLGQMKVTIYTTNKKPITNIPLTQFLPDGERQYYPLDEPFAVGDLVTVDLVSTTANSATTNPIILVCHHEVE